MSSRTDGMAQNSNGNLLFINKTSTSASLSNSRSNVASRKQINRHVQSTRNLTRERHARIDRVKPAQYLPILTSTRARSSQDGPPARSPPTPPTTPLVSSQPLDTLPASTSEDEEAEEVSPCSRLSLLIPQGASVEPFGICKVSLDNQQYRMLQYFVLEMFPVLSRADTRTPFKGPVSPGPPAVAQLIRDCLTEEMHTYALLTASSSRMKFLTGATFSETELVERYADITMRLLRTYLSRNGPVDQRLIMTIYFLWATESYRKDWNAVRTHQNMIKMLVKTHLGGFHNLNDTLRRMIWFGDRFTATATATPPIIEESCESNEISPVVATRILRAISESGQIPMGAAFDQYSIDFFAQEFRILVREVTQLACVVQCYWTGVELPIPDRDWVNVRSIALLDRLLFFKDSRPLQSPSLAMTLQDCVRIAMITWIACVGSPETGPGSESLKNNIKIRVAVDARPLRRRFTALLTQTGEAGLAEQERSIERLCLWIAALGWLASELQENIEWFCERFHHLARHLQIDSWAAFAPIGRGFLWLDCLEVVNNFRLRSALEGKELSTN